MEKYIMALDQGTTSSRCILFAKDGTQAAFAQKEFAQIYPKPGWVEQDAMEIWGTQMGVAQEAMQTLGATYEQIEAIGITNQRETCIVWDKNTGKPVYNAIVWQCRRTSEYCSKLKERGLTEQIQRKTGLLPDPYFSATKLHWILENVKDAREKAENGDLLFGTVDTWLIWNLTKGKSHATDVSNASRTMLYNINDLTWDKDLLLEFNIPQTMLPDVKDTNAFFGETDPALFGGGIPILAAVGDQQSALFGHGCVTGGSAKNTFGTGGFLLMNTGENPVYSSNRLLTTIAWRIDGKLNYALEGSVFVAGAAIQWLRDELKLIDSSRESEECALKVKDTNGVYFVPAFVGLGAPYWEAEARGSIFGLTRGANKDHIIRATLESLAYQTYDVLHAMEEDAKLSLKILKTDGGAASNRFLLQFLADITSVPVEHPKNSERTAFGAAKLAGLASGFWIDYEAKQEKLEEVELYSPAIEALKRKTLLEGWKRAIDCSLYYAQTAKKEGADSNEI
ncbi:MAG: glycerol kinase GlpK [Eubacteriales bacterium]|nr:glycerol kinase GlpK [Eubacteriales bacterium]MDD3349270.1 glycerol kinase GlpK [Eubacteriales bacterium]